MADQLRNKIMFKCECGSEEFFAHTTEAMAIQYDGNGEEVDGGEIIGVERPAWNKAYHCSECDKAYSSLPPLDAETEWIEERGRRYLDKHGAVCPICKCNAIEGGPFQSDGTTVWQSVTCTECDAEWDDIYYLREVEITSYPTDKVPKEILEIDPNEAFKR